MTTDTTRWFVQITQPSGDWVDITEPLWTQSVAEAYFRMWVGLKSTFFCVRVVSRETLESEVLLDHVNEF